jgi:hypothetical protein
MPKKWAQDVGLKGGLAVVIAAIYLNVAYKCNCCMQSIGREA